MVLNSCRYDGGHNMGTRLTKAGLVIQLHDADGKPAGDPLFGRHAHIQGLRQSEVLQQSGALSPEEADHPGSQHWLTLVAAADSHEKLEKILRDAYTPDGECFTSCSSRRVRVELHIGEERRSFQNAVTIASGPIVSLDLDHPNVHVVHVRVLPHGATMTKDLIAEFDGGSRALQFQ
jgi:hypothetical protein